MFTKEQADKLLKGGHITPETHQRIIQHYAMGTPPGGAQLPISDESLDGGSSAMPAPNADISALSSQQPISEDPNKKYNDLFIQSRELVDKTQSGLSPEMKDLEAMKYVQVQKEKDMADQNRLAEAQKANAHVSNLVEQQKQSLGISKPQAPPANPLPDQAMISGAPTGQAPTQQAMPQYEMPGERAYTDYLNKSLAAQTGLAGATAEESKRAAQAESDRFKVYQDSKARVQANVDNLSKELDGKEVNPNQYWENKGAVGKIGAVLGMLISGAGSGVTGKENLAIKLINQEIDRDIDAQKQNIANKQSLLSKYQAQLGDPISAENAARLHLLTVSEYKMKEAAAKATTAQAQAGFQKGLYDLQMQKNAMQLELAKAMGDAQLRGVSSGGVGGVPIGQESYAQATNPEIQKKLVPVYDRGRSYVARSDSEAEKLRDAEGKFSEAKGMLNQLKSLSTIEARWTPEQRAKADQIKHRLPMLLNEINGYNRFTDMDEKEISQTFTEPSISSAIFAPNAKTNQLLSQLDEQMERKRGLVLQGYKPVLSFKPGVK